MTMYVDTLHLVKISISVYRPVNNVGLVNFGFFAQEGTRVHLSTCTGCYSTQPVAMSIASPQIKYYAE